MTIKNTLIYFAAFMASVSAQGSCPSNPPNNPIDGSAPPVPAICKNIDPMCTTYMEKLFHMKTFYNRAEGTTPEEFNHYWANNHVALVKDFHIRLGVVKYSQYHSTENFRGVARGVEGAPPVLEYDGAAEYWARDIATFERMLSDNEYVTKIQPDEANFLDPKSVKIIIGVDYIVVENQNAVKEHGRSF